MTTLLIHYAVTDFAAFKAEFDAFEATRRAHGATGHRLLHAEGDPDRVVVVIDFPTHEAARAFETDPARAAALQRAGVRGGSDRVDYLAPVEITSY